MPIANAPKIAKQRRKWFTAGKGPLPPAPVHLAGPLGVASHKHATRARGWERFRIVAVEAASMEQTYEKAWNN